MCRLKCPPHIWSTQSQQGPPSLTTPQPHQEVNVAQQSVLWFVFDGIDKYILKTDQHGEVAMNQQVTLFLYSSAGKIQ